jgi:hypothetical protein
MTESARQALVGLRDVTTLQWYFIPMLAALFWVYVGEIGQARKSGNWDPVVAGAALFFADILNETVNGWIFALSKYSGLWLVPGPSALRVMVGLNVEIMAMFAVAGIIYYKSLGPDPRARILGIPDRWFWALLYSAVSVCVELVLNSAHLLIWDYRFWNRGAGLILILVFGYIWFYLAAKFAIERKTLRGKIAVPVVLCAASLLLNVVGQGLLGLRY